MRNTAKTTTLERFFPILALENDCLLSKQGDTTVCFQVHLPEIFTQSKSDYQAIHELWHKALKILPQLTIVHKQDWYLKSRYQANFQDPDQDFLQRSSELHFNQRPYLTHRSYVYITYTSKERIRSQSISGSLVRGSFIPKALYSEVLVEHFLECVAQFEKIINDSDLIKLQRLDQDALLGQEDKVGLLQEYMALGDSKHQDLVDLNLKPDALQVGANTLSVHCLSDTDCLPAEVSCCYEYQKLSTDKSQMLLSFAAPLGLLLDCNHIYNQYVFLQDSDSCLEQFEKTAKNMQALSRYSRANQINKQWIDTYLNRAHSKGLQVIKAHFNVMAWSDQPEELKSIKNQCGSAIAQMGCLPRYNTVDAPSLFWAGIPGNSADFPSEESFYTFLEPALCFFSAETQYKSSLSSFGIRMADRISGIPIDVDLSDLPMKKGIISNRNKFILGPSGSGKSFFTNHMVRQYYEQNAHVLLVDTGNSYQGLCDLIHAKTQGSDGVYFTYTQETPISFNPFYTHDGQFDIEKKESIKTLILTLWKREDQRISRAEEVALSNAVTGYIKLLQNQEVQPSFNTFYEFVQTRYKEELKRKQVREKDFDLANFLNVLEPYYQGGEYDYLLNSEKEIDLLHKRFIVFEIDSIKGAPVKVA